MTKQEFVERELQWFDEGNILPYRVAVSNNFNGGDYAYGSHTQIREYADTTIGYAGDRDHAVAYLEEAWDYAEFNNNKYYEDYNDEIYHNEEEEEFQDDEKTI